MATDVNVEVEMETVEVDEGEGIGEADTTLRPAAQRVPRQKKRKGLRLSLILNAITFGHTFARHLTLCKGTNDAGLGGWAMFKGWEIHVRSMSVEFMAGLAAGAWTGLTLMRRYKKTKCDVIDATCSYGSVCSPTAGKRRIGRDRFWILSMAVENSRF